MLPHLRIGFKSGLKVVTTYDATVPSATVSRYKNQSLFIRINIENSLNDTDHAVLFD